MDSEWFVAATKNSAMGTAAAKLAWDKSTLGRPATWPAPLRQAVQLCFSTRFPVMIAWGPEYLMIYNDGYRDMLGTDKRLAAMGVSARIVWGEVWDELGPLFDSVMTDGVPTWATDSPLLMNRSGFEEEAYFTFSYSPIVDEVGNVLGVMDIASETTAQVIDRRRLTTIDALHIAMQDHRGGMRELAALVINALATSEDITRASIYLPTGGDLELVGTTDPARPELVPTATVERVFATKQPSSTPPLLVIPLARPHDRTPIGVIALEGITRRPFDARQRSFLMVVASAVGAAMSAARAEHRLRDLLEAHAELAAREAQQVRETSLTLQHSLLTPPPRSANLDIAVRYRPATKDLEIGGDWYDAFVTHDGATVLVIGDVTGHDHHAAAAMGQIRGLIRAIAFDSCSAPAVVLEHTDRAIHGLRLGLTATATTVVVKVLPAAGGDSGRTIEWSNAGHPSPVIIRADGQVEVLRRTNDLILGLSPNHERTNHTARIEPGDTLLLYTDGLIERRHRTIQESLDALMSAVHGGHRETVDELSDRVLATLIPDTADDDVALIAMRLRPAAT